MLPGEVPFHVESDCFGGILGGSRQRAALTAADELVVLPLLLDVVDVSPLGAQNALLGQFPCRGWRHPGLTSARGGALAGNQHDPCFLDRGPRRGTLVVALG